MKPLTYTGAMKIYFNRHAKDMLVWFIAPDDGSWELAVALIQFDGCDIMSEYDPPEEGEVRTWDDPPTAWFNVYGTLTVDGDIAKIVPA